MGSQVGNLVAVGAEVEEVVNVVMIVVEAVAIAKASLKPVVP